MKRLGWLAACGISAMAMAQDPAPQVVQPPAAPAGVIDLESVIKSRSKQFHIVGGDAKSRGVTAMLVERTKDELLHLTQEVDGWKVPVIITLHGREGDPAPNRTFAMKLEWVGSLPQLRLDKHLGPGLEPERMKRVVTELLIYQRYLESEAAKPSDNLVAVPPWLSLGLCEASAWRLDETDRALYAALFKKGGVFKLEDLLQTTPESHRQMDSATRAAFRVSCGALVMALLEQPDGREGFRNFLKKVATFQGEMPILLRAHFPDLNLSENSLAKWWALQLANKGGLSLLTDVMTIQETETKLAEALVFHVPLRGGGSKTKPLTDWPEVLALEAGQRVDVIMGVQQGLVHLSYRCFPPYRPMLRRYQKTLIGIAQGKSEGVSRTFAELESARKSMVLSAQRARDYLDWFEITRARKTSGEFEDYLKLKDRLKADRYQRGDDISTYLDRMNEIFEREGQDPMNRIPGLPEPYEFSRD